MKTNEFLIDIFIYTISNKCAQEGEEISYYFSENEFGFDIYCCYTASGGLLSIKVTDYENNIEEHIIVDNVIKCDDEEEVREVLLTCIEVGL